MVGFYTLLFTLNSDLRREGVTLTMLDNVSYVLCHRTAKKDVKYCDREQLMYLYSEWFL